MADLSISARMHRILPSSILRMIEPDCLGSAEAHMQTNARCVMVHPCATDGVLEPLACTTATHQVISRLLTSHPQNVHLQALGSTDDCTQATSFGFYRDLFRATTVSNISLYLTLSVAQIPAAGTTRPARSPCGSPLRWD